MVTCCDQGIVTKERFPIELNGYSQLRKMNTIELRILEEENEFWLKLLVDSKRVLKEEAIVIKELIKSKRGTGNYLIFTCTCGIADCGGWDRISVEHNENTINWKFNYGEIEYSFEFNKKYYFAEIDRITFELNKRKIELGPKYLVFPE